MKLLGHLRSRSKLKDGVEAKVYENHSLPARPKVSNNKLRPGRESALPARILERIFVFVCPHTQDEAHTTLEDSMVEDGCMLCDMRDLAQCALVCRRWAGVAQNLLYALLLLSHS